MKLTITNEDKKNSSFTIELYDKCPELGATDDANSVFDESGIIYSKEHYRLEFDELKDASVRILLNDAPPALENKDLDIGMNGIENGCGTVNNDGKLQAGRIFDDQWGLVQIRIILDLDGQKQEWFSKYLHVEGSHTSFDAFLNTAGYVYQNIPDLLVRNGPMRSKVQTELRRASLSMLELQLKLIERTLSVYEKYRSFFLQNSRTKTEREYAVDEARRLQQMTPASLVYAAVHPEQLSPAEPGHGIRVGRGYYMPEKILMQRNVLSRDTYENREILGFLRLLSDSLRAVEAEIRKVRSSAKIGFVMLKNGALVSKYSLPEAADISRLRTRLSAMTVVYEQIFDFPAPNTMSYPKATPIFLTVPQYREVYELITAWYKGVYDFEGTKFLLQCIGSSRLYESFVLVSFYRWFRDNEYRIDSYKAIQWEKDKKTYINNKYVFKKDGTTVSLYYEPKISNEENEIGLKRKSEGFYTPDYVLKIEKSGNAFIRYVICDAKFSTYDMTRRKRYPGVLKKYFDDISNDNVNNGPVPLCIVYGEYQDEDPLKTVFGETVYKKDGTDKEAVDAMIIPIIPPRKLIKSTDQSNDVKDIKRNMKAIDEIMKIAELTVNKQ